MPGMQLSPFNSNPLPHHLLPHLLKPAPTSLHFTKTAFFLNFSKILSFNLLPIFSRRPPQPQADWVGCEVGLRRTISWINYNYTYEPGQPVAKELLHFGHFGNAASETIKVAHTSQSHICPFPDTFVKCEHFSVKSSIVSANRRVITNFLEYMLNISVLATYSNTC